MTGKQIEAAVPNSLLPAAYGITLPSWRPGQLESIEWMRATEKTREKLPRVSITEQPTGCHRAGYLLLLHDGSLKKVEDIVVGNLLMGPDGKPRRVLQLCRGTGQMYAVWPKKGNPFVVNSEHYLALASTTKRRIITVRAWLNWDKREGRFFELYRMPVPGNPTIQRTGFTVHQLGIEPYYGFVLDGDQLYLSYDFTVMHNSGKSAIAMALNGQPIEALIEAFEEDASRESNQVLALTRTRSLQNQYHDLFPDCHVHFGRSRYPCNHPERIIPHATAQECLYKGRTSLCTYRCPYLESRQKCLYSQRVCFNYAYWFTEPRTNPTWLVLDEAHNLPDLILDHTGTIINEYQRVRWELPDFPRIGYDSYSLFEEVDPCSQAEGWLAFAQNVMQEHIQDFSKQLQDANPGDDGLDELVKEASAAEHLLHRLEATAQTLASRSGQHWYIRSGPLAVRYRGEDIPGLDCRPLTARYDFKRLFPLDKRLLLMSATIGKPEAFAEELGLKEDAYRFRLAANQWPPEARQVHILDAPSMGRASAMRDPSIFDKQADVIARAIKEQPSSWSGLILVTRKTEARLLADRLAHRGLAKRIFVMPGADGVYIPTDDQVKAWQVHKQRHPNALCVSFSMWEGYDGLDEKILIVAKAPYPDTSSDYEETRRSRYHTMYLQRTAWQMEQGLGRTRRGRPEDYDSDGIKRGFVAIADASWGKVKDYLSAALREALIED